MSLGVINIKSGGSTNRKSARKLVRRGRAFWTGTCQCGSCDRCIEIDFYPNYLAFAERPKPAYFDGSQATLRQVKGLPVAGDAVVLFLKRSRQSLAPATA